MQDLLHRLAMEFASLTAENVRLRQMAEPTSKIEAASPPSPEADGSNKPYRKPGFQAGMRAPIRVQMHSAHVQFDGQSDDPCERAAGIGAPKQFDAPCDSALENCSTNGHSVRPDVRFSHAMADTGSDSCSAQSLTSSGRKARSNNSLRFFTPARPMLTEQLSEHDFLPRLRAKRFLDSPQCDLAVSIFIIAHTCVMIVEMQYKGIEAGYIVGYPGYTQPADRRWPGAEATFIGIDKAFTLLFGFELVCRISIFQTDFFRHPQNAVDVFAVAVGIVCWAATSASWASNSMMARLLRLMRLTRASRLAKYAKALESLQLILKCIRASVLTLSWSLGILMVFQCIASMIISQTVIEYVQDDKYDPILRMQAFEYFGTFSKAMISMSEVHLANWGPIVRVIINTLGEWQGSLLTGYRCLAGFAILQVINAVFVQQTMKVAQKDAQFMIMQRQRAQAQFGEHIHKIFAELDASGDGVLTWEEFNSLSTDESFKHWLAALEIDVHDLRLLFDILDTDCDGTITVEECVGGGSRIKGGAKAIDLVCLMSQVKALDEKLDSVLLTLLAELRTGADPRGASLTRGATYDSLPFQAAATMPGQRFSRYSS